MVRLLVDIGNSRIKWNCANDETLRVTTAVMRSDDGLPSELLTAWQGLAAPAAVWAVSVAGAGVDHILAQWVKENWGLAVQFAKPSSSRYGIITRYREPQKLGADRWVAMIGAREQAPVCVIDCGTAITLDVLTVRREHVGGLIVPGLNLMRASLTQRVPGIRAGVVDSVGTETGVLGLDTVSGVQQGTLRAIVGAIRHCVADIEAAYGPLARQITGGDGALIQSLLGDEYNYVPDLVLHGLLKVALEEQ
ncbi:MAG: type III pantothenate kinase [Gammaproteobacteria bacterium]|nr:type III pantothenate kinase [Gammaproteobacteria bacterium]